MDWDEDRDSREEELSMLRRLGSSVESEEKRGGASDPEGEEPGVCRSRSRVTVLQERI